MAVAKTNKKTTSKKQKKTAAKKTPAKKKGARKKAVAVPSSRIDYDAQMNFDTLTRAEEIKANPTLMKAVKKEAARRQKAISKLNLGN